MLQTKMLYTLDDVAIQPADTSSIKSRKECNPYIDEDDKMLPLFTAPMDTVVSLKNYKEFLQNGITPIIPRTVPYGKRLEMCVNEMVWVAFSLKEFEESFIKNKASVDSSKKFALIDIANGHMEKVQKVVNEAKKMHGINLTIMVGNVANPETYRLLSMCGADYIRLSIGSGHACLSSTHLGIHYPMASLIDECYKIKCSGSYAKIVADGGMRNYGDIIKALALGADYVMCGWLFNQMVESAATTFIRRWSGQVKGYEWMNFVQPTNELPDDMNLQRLLVEAKAPLFKEFYGMSTKKAQSLMGKRRTTTSEGVDMKQDVVYTMRGWVENFTDYLRSAMSYTGSKDLYDFCGEVTVNIVSPNTYKFISK